MYHTKHKNYCRLANGFDLNYNFNVNKPTILATEPILNTLFLEAIDINE